MSGHPSIQSLINIIYLIKILDVLLYRAGVRESVIQGFALPSARETHFQNLASEGYQKNNVSRVLLGVLLGESTGKLILNKSFSQGFSRSTPRRYSISSCLCVGSTHSIGLALTQICLCCDNTHTVRVGNTHIVCVSNTHRQCVCWQHIC